MSIYAVKQSLIPISKRAKAVMEVMVKDLNKDNNHRKIDNTEKTFMPVVVEHIGDIENYDIFSIAHYFIQNGDMMADPEMTYLRIDGEFYPMSFKNASLGIDRQYLLYRNKKISYIPSAYNDSRSFTTKWFSNIKQQQGLKTVPVKRKVNPYSVKELKKNAKMIEVLNFELKSNSLDVVLTIHKNTALLVIGECKKRGELEKIVKKEVRSKLGSGWNAKISTNAIWLWNSKEKKYFDFDTESTRDSIEANDE